MNKINKHIFGAAAAFTLLSAGVSHAAIQVSSLAYDAPLSPGQTLVADIDDPTAAGYSLIGGEVHQGPLVVGVAAPPAGDTSKYLAVTSSETATFSSDKALTSLSVYIGSLDTYNNITFDGANGFTETLTGTELLDSITASPSSGDQFSGQTNRRFYFTFGGDAVDKVLFQSSGNSLEFDNIAVSAAPDPSTWALMIAGVGLAGYALRRGRPAALSLAGA